MNKKSNLMETVGLAVSKSVFDSLSITAIGFKANRPPASIVHAQFGIILRVLRENVGLTQEQLNAKIGYSPTSGATVSHWELGFYTPPLEKLQLLSQILKYDFSALWERMSEIQTPPVPLATQK